MWLLSNRTPFAAERTWTRDKDGNHIWVVAMKATFDFDEAGGLRAADQQEPPLREPHYAGEPGASSLLYEADLVPPKPATDVVINACADAPGGWPAASVPVAVYVHDLEKALVVHGERVYRRSRARPVPSPAKPFARRPIVYEGAYGGTDLSDADPQRQRIDSRNPVGRGVAIRDENLIDQPTHWVEYLEGDPAQRGPAGYGAIASHWSPRRELQGTFDDAWFKRRRPLLPSDHDPRAALCAPADQRPARRLAGGESIVLVNMSPRGRLALTLPRLRFTFTTHFGAAQRRHEATLGTVVIEPELGKLRLIYQTGLAVGPRETDQLDFTIVEHQTS